MVLHDAQVKHHRDTHGWMADDNRPHALETKFQLRRQALELIGADNAHVLEVFAGQHGRMHAEVWHQAKSCTGLDIHFELSDPRTRYVGDSLRLLRQIELSAYNIFDIDPWGDPWHALYLIAKRRVWKSGERVCLTVTDGAWMKLRTGEVTAGVIGLVGVRAISPDAAERVRLECLQAVLDIARASMVRRFEAVSGHGKRGSVRMVYSCWLLQVR